MKNDQKTLLNVLKRLREWAIENKEEFAERAKSLDNDKIHFEAEKEWQKYFAFNMVVLWADEEIRQIYVGRYPVDASTFTE